MYQDNQPQPVQEMTIPPGGNRNAKHLPYNPQGKREWSHGLCSCFDDCGTFCFAWFCPCMVYAQVKKRVDHLNQYGSPDAHRGGSGCDGDCMLWCCLQSFLAAGWVLQTSNRGAVRSRYNIDGVCLSDCMVSCCCPPFALTQESREIDLEERTWTPAHE